MVSDILKLIRSTKEYIPDSTIAKAAMMTEYDVHANVNQLIRQGYDIEYVEGKGFHLNSYPETICSAELLSRATTNWAGKTVLYRSETTSTNEEAKYAAENGREHGTLVVAENQTAGRGRRGRSWESDGKNSVAMSLILRPSFGAEKAPMITLLMALSVAEVLSKLTDLSVKIKWPNDVLINKKKVCGILTEMAADKGAINHVIVGVGINVNQKMMPEEIGDIATSLLIEKGDRYSRADIILAVMEFFEYYFDIFCSTGDLSDVVSLYESYLINKDETVRVLDPKGEYNGVATGINDFGELVVQKEDGSYTRVSSGEVSVRGVYGYV